MDRVLPTVLSPLLVSLRRVLRSATSLLFLLPLFAGAIDCAMSDTGSLDFVNNLKPPKKPPKPCGGDGDCAPPTPYCDMVTATCIECLADPNCAGPKKVCGPGGACVECVADPNCGRGKPYCDIERSTCAECLNDVHCEAAKVCDLGEHRCVPTCADSSTCEATKPYCDAVRRLCVECVTDANCADPKKPACSPLGACTECAVSAHCQPDRPLCDVMTNKCVGCFSDLDCPPGRRCDPMQHCAP